MPFLIIMLCIDYFFMAFIKASSAVISSCVKPERSIDSFFSNPNRYLVTTSKKATTIKLPDSLTVDDITYKVTMVAAKASVYKKYVRGKGNKTIRVK